MGLSRALFLHTAYYCEENVWHLARDPRLPEAERFAVFISNPARSVAIHCQRAAVAPEEPVHWDYHVVLVALSTAGPLVYDLDTTLELPCPLGQYLAQSFRSAPRARQPRFRVLPAPLFVERFSSDRSHMRRGWEWAAPPPPWPCIQREGVASNLMSFVDMEAPFLGRVVGLAELPGCFAT